MADLVKRAKHARKIHLYSLAIRQAKRLSKDWARLLTGERAAYATGAGRCARPPRNVHPLVHLGSDIGPEDTQNNVEGRNINSPGWQGANLDAAAL